jgi:hypothetical protein
MNSRLQTLDFRPRTCHGYHLASSLLNFRAWALRLATAIPLDRYKRTSEDPNNPGLNKSAEWQEEEQALLVSLRELEQGENPERALDRVRILELANKAHSLHVTQGPQEKAKLLRMVLSNCAVDAVNVYPTYRKPFDIIFERAKTGEWWAWVDSNNRPHPYQGCALTT